MSVRTRDPMPEAPPSWDDYWSTVGNEDYLIARRLIDLSGSVRRHFEQFIRYEDRPVMVEVPGRPSYDPGEPDPDGWVRRSVDLDWSAAARDSDEWPCSSTERRLLDLILSLIQPDLERDWDTGLVTGARLVNIRDLSEMGSWRDDVAAILNAYITGRPA